MSSVETKKEEIDLRIQRGNLALSSTNGRCESPLAPCEAYFVEMMIELSYCCYQMIASDGFQLISSLIKNTEIKSKVKDWKLKHICTSNIND